MAEVAEAVGTSTDLVMAVHSDGICLYTPEGTEDIYRCQLDHDVDGILVAGPGTFVATFAEFQAEIQTFMDRVRKTVDDA